MNAAVPPLRLELADGEAFRPVDITSGAVVASGRLELYAVLESDGATVSGRHFVGAIEPGGLLAPLMTGAEGVALLAVATDPTVLAPVAAAVAFQASNAAAVDAWVLLLAQALAAVAEAAPAEVAAYGAGETFEVAAGDAVAARSGLVWFSGATLARPGAAPSGASIPLALGSWLEAAAEGACATGETADLLARGDALPAIRAFHTDALAAFGAHLAAQTAAAEARAGARAERDQSLTRRMTGRFADVFRHAPGWTGAAAPDEPLLGPFCQVAEALAVDLPLRIRASVARARTVEEAGRAARMRQRRIALRGEWWRDDFGPFIGYLDEARRPVAVLQKGRGAYRIVDPDGGSDIAVDRRSAGRIAPFGHMLYAPLPARPLGFSDLSKFGRESNARDLKVAVAAGAAMALLGVAIPLSMRIAFDRFIPSNEVHGLALLAAGLVIVALIGAVSRFAFDTAMLRMDSRGNGQIQAAIVDRILRMPAHALRIPSADLAMRAGAVGTVSRSISSVGIGAALSGMVCAVNAGLMLFYAPSAAVLAIGAALLLLGLAYVCASKQLETLRKGEALLADVNTIVVHLLNGIGVLRAAGAEERAFARWGQDFAELRARSYRSQKLGTLFETVLSGFDTLTLAGVLLFLASMERKTLPVGLFISFVWSYGAFMTSAAQLARAFNAALGMKPSWERAAPLLRAMPDDSAPKRDPGVLTGAVELTQVHFRYDPEGPYALGNVSLAVRPGEFVAIVGPSGSGKSTLMRMLLAQDHPQGGSVAYDGVDLRHLDIELVRRQIGVVLQNGRLVPGSILENVAGGHSATPEEAWAALRAAGLEDDVKALPMGLHTILTEATAAFSGGQVQRLMIARALIGKPRLLLFDEATSALDNLTQAIVTESLVNMAVTRIVIAHRLVTVRQAHRIVVMDQGRVVEVGTFDELAAAGKTFSALIGRQLL